MVKKIIGFSLLGRWCREQVPIIEAATSLRIEDFSFFKEEGTEILVDTFTRVGKV